MNMAMPLESMSTSLAGMNVTSSASTRCSRHSIHVAHDWTRNVCRRRRSPSRCTWCVSKCRKERCRHRITGDRDATQLAMSDTMMLAVVLARVPACDLDVVMCMASASIGDGYDYPRLSCGSMLVLPNSSVSEVTPSARSSLAEACIKQRVSSSIHDSTDDLWNWSSPGPNSSLPRCQDWSVFSTISSAHMVTSVSVRIHVTVQNARIRHLPR